LIRRSRYLPRIIGTLLVVVGFAYVAFSIAQMLAPTLAARYLFPWLILPGFVAELWLALRLLIRGVDVATWPGHLHERAAA
jgi:hypothetical protein